jgi:cobalt/nickel transport system permease protein
MVGVHALVGVGEGIITALVVGSVLATRPDLVFGARDLATDPFALPDGSGGPTPEPAR